MSIGIMPAAVALAGVLAAPALAAQEHKLPRALARYGDWLPADPNEYVRQLVTGELSRRSGGQGGLWRLFVSAGRPSGGGWIGAAYAALEQRAETEPLAQNAMVSVWYTELSFAYGFETGRNETGSVCPEDFPRAQIEVLLAEQLRRAWNGGVWAAPVTSHPAEPVRTMLREAMTWATAPEAYAVLRDIARDPEVFEHRGYRDGFEIDFRRDAARAMVEHLMNGGMSRAEAFKDRRVRPGRGHSRLRLATGGFVGPGR